MEVAAGVALVEDDAGQGRGVHVVAVQGAALVVDGALRNQRDADVLARDGREAALGELVGVAARRRAARDRHLRHLDGRDVDGELAMGLEQAPRVARVADEDDEHGAPPDDAHRAPADGHGVRLPRLGLRDEQAARLPQRRHGLREELGPLNGCLGHMRGLLPWPMMRDT